MSAATAWACIGVVSLQASPTSVTAGGTVTVSGRDFVPNQPVQIHLDTLSGPLLTTVTQMTGSVMSSYWSVLVTIPASVAPGDHVLIGYQVAHNMNSGNPARAVISVGGAAPAAESVSGRPAAPVLDSGIGAGTLALIAVAAAGVGLVVLGLIVVGAARVLGGAGRTARAE